MKRLKRFNDRYVTLLAFALGVVVAACVYSPGYIVGSSEWWTYPPRDFNSHLIGYRMYLLDAWRFPLFYTATMEEPRGLNLLYMDALPLVALPAKVLVPFVPEPIRGFLENPFAWWPALSYGLQAAFAARLVRELDVRSAFAQLCAAVFALATPILVFRFLHTALLSHFLILWSILLYLRTVRRETWPRAALGWCAMFATATLIHPYLFAMCAGIFAAALGTWLLQRRVRDAFAAGGATVAVVVVLCALGGFFGREVSKGGLWGYGYKSTDLLSFVTPQWATLFPFTQHALRIDMTKTESAEGYAYLGFGGFVLLVLMLVREPRAIGRAIGKHKLLFAAVVLMAWFAVSHRISVGGKIALELPLPSFMDWPARQFRSSGRFVWPAVYVAMFYLLALAFRTFERGRFALVPPLIVLVQAIDILAAYVYVRGYTAHAQSKYLDWEVMRPAIHAHRSLTFGPAVQCIDWRQPLIFLKHMEVEFLASERGVGLSNILGSRPFVDCPRDATSRATTPVKLDHLYVLFPPDAPAAEAAHYEAGGAPCATYENVLACSSQFATAVPKGFVPYSPPIDYAPGDVVHFGTKDESELHYLGIGWSWPEATLRWSIGDTSLIYLRPSRALGPDTRLYVTASGPVLEGRKAPSASVRVNGAYVGSMVLDAGPRAFDYPLPGAVLASTARLLEIEIRPVDYRAPSTLTASTDSRELGVAMHDLRVE